VVKVVGTPIAERRLRALYFTRAVAPFGDGPLYHHIGLYAFRRDALARFVKLPLPRSNGGKSSSNCAPSKRECASM
jgi:CMP-2-keto-3-deoxyoctulosonic acid synthetase